VINRFIYKFFTEYLLYFLIFIFAARSASFLESRIFIIIAFTLSLFLFLRKSNTFDRSIIILMGLWTLINIVAYLQFDNIPDVPLINFLSVTARYLFPYFMLKIYKGNYVDSIERIIFTLAVISLPIFAIQVLFTNYFYAVAPYLNAITVTEQKVQGGWYVGFYMFNSWDTFRNSGFMWEPGAFAFMLILGLLIRLHNNNVTFDKYVVLYGIAMLTTFSTMGYIVLIIIILSVTIRIRNLLVYLTVVPLILFIVSEYILELDFILPKIESYFDNVQTVQRSGHLSGEILRVNRFGILYFAIEESIKWPFGYGVFDDTPAILIYNERISGPSTYADLLLRWGWLGLVLFVWAVFRFTNRVFPYINIAARNLIFLAMLASVGSYGLLHNVILLSLLYYPFVSSEKLTPDKSTLHVNINSKQNKISLH
jgi:hypothetical protein